MRPKDSWWFGMFLAHLVVVVLGGLLTLMFWLAFRMEFGW